MTLPIGWNLETTKMKILLTGATGYIGKRLLTALAGQGHRVVCAVRDPARLVVPDLLKDRIEVIKLDLLDASTLENIPTDIDGAYYLVHSMSASRNYNSLEEQSAKNFRRAMDATEVRHVIYLSGIANEEDLSTHLASRKKVEEVLSTGKYHFTTLRAGIIIGSGSASFEIIRDLVEKLPIMVTPKWLRTKCQPVGVNDVVTMLSESFLHEQTYGRNFDIGGPDILTYEEMLLTFARIRGLKRSIVTLPVITPRLSSYWLYFVTSTSYNLAVALVNSMNVEVICRDNELCEILGIEPIGYEAAIRQTFKQLSQEDLSSWKDSQVSGRLNFNISDFIQVPTYGCFKDERRRKYRNRQNTIEKVWNLGGRTGWYHANLLWRFRGFIDKVLGGVGLRRGRSREHSLHVGDALDFWRVLYANKEEGRLLLFAEMRLPGEAWLEFKIEGEELRMTATFRPRGLLGRFYWFAVLPLHELVFPGMLKKLTGVSNHEHESSKKDEGLTLESAK